MTEIHEKNKKVLIIAILSLLSLLLVSNPTIINTVGNAIFDAKAIFDTLSLQITIYDF